MSSDNLHLTIGKILNQFHNPPSTAVILASGCGGCRRLGFFSTTFKSRATNYCWADACIVNGNAVRTVIEIESEIVTPAKLGGKLLPLALSTCLHCKGAGGAISVRGGGLALIQVVDTAWLKPATRKLSQYQNLQAHIRRLLPMGSIAEYSLLAGTSASFASKEKNYALLINLVESSLRG